MRLLGEPGSITMLFGLVGVGVPVTFAALLGLVWRSPLYRAALQVILYVLVLTLGYFMPSIVSQWCEGEVTSKGCEALGAE